VEQADSGSPCRRKNTEKLTALQILTADTVSRFFSAIIEDILTGSSVMMHLQQESTMETTTSPNRIHPLIATAAVAVTLVSLTGVAAITGLLPTSHSTASPAATPASSLVSTSDSEAKETRNQAVADKAQAVTENAKLNKPAAAIKEEKSVKSASASKEDKPPKAAPLPSRVAAASAPQRDTGYSSTPETTQRNTRYSSTPDYTQRAPQTARASYCDNCGRIESVNAIAQAAAPSGLGIAAGAVIGGLLGNQVGDGSGQKLATIAGAVGGGFAGNEVEKRTRSATTYEIRVRMEDGSMRTIPQSSTNGWQVGDQVKVVNGSLVSNS
jgi:outer membrane lipoprotein SlyB